MVKALAAACVGGFLLQMVLEMAGAGGFDAAGGFLQTFGLVPARVLGRGRVWQLFTYIFLHGGMGHILFNVLSLWMFGSPLEREWGPRRLLGYFMLTGVGAGLFSMAFRPLSSAPVIGASGAIYGLLLAYGMLHPDRPILVWFVFPVKAKWFVLGLGAMAFLASLQAPGDGVAHIAHLGGMLFGWAWLKRAWRVRGLLREVKWWLRRRRLRAVKRGGGGPRYPFHY